MVSDQLFVGRRRPKTDAGGPVSARKLAASLWRLTNGGGSGRWQRRSFDRVGIQHSTEEAAKWGSKPRFDSTRGMDSEKEFNKKKRWMINNLRREREYRKKIEREATSSARKFMDELVKEKKEREALEDMCKELGKEIEGYKGEICELKGEREKIREEVENERKTIQVARLWREEQARMKICDAELILENKYSEMSELIGEFNELLIMSRKSNKTVSSSDKSEGGGVKKVGMRNRNPHVVRGMEGHVEWPQQPGIIRTGPSQRKLLEAKFQSQINAPKRM